MYWCLGCSYFVLWRHFELFCDREDAEARQMALPVEMSISVIPYLHLVLKVDPPWLQVGIKVCTVTMAMHAYSVLLPFYNFGTWLNILPYSFPTMKSLPWHQMDLSRQAPIPSLEGSALQVVKVVFLLVLQFLTQSCLPSNWEDFCRATEKQKHVRTTFIIATGRLIVQWIDLGITIYREYKTSYHNVYFKTFSLVHGREVWFIHEFCYFDFLSSPCKGSVLFHCAVLP